MFQIWFYTNHERTYIFVNLHNFIFLIHIYKRLLELVLFTGCFTVKMHNKWFLWKFSVWNASCDTSKQLQVDVVPNLQTICKSVEVFCHILAVSLISLNHVVISFLFRIKKKCLFIFEYYIKYFFKSLFTCTGYFSSIWSSFLIFWKITSLKNMTATLITR